MLPRRHLTRGMDEPAGVRRRRGRADRGHLPDRRCGPPAPAGARGARGLTGRAHPGRRLRTRLLLRRAAPGGGGIGVDRGGRRQRGHAGPGRPPVRRARQRRAPRGGSGRAPRRGLELRRGAVRPGAGVRRRPDRRPGRDAPCPAGRRSHRRVGHRLGHRVRAFGERRSHRASARCLGRAPRPSIPASDARRAASLGGVRRRSNASPPVRDDRLRSGHLRRRARSIIARFVAGRKGITDAEADEWVAEQRALGQRRAFYFASTQCCFTARKPH